MVINNQLTNTPYCGHNRDSITLHHRNVAVANDYLALSTFITDTSTHTPFSTLGVTIIVARSSCAIVFSGKVTRIMRGAWIIVASKNKWLRKIRKLQTMTRVWRAEVFDGVKKSSVSEIVFVRTTILAVTFPTFVRNSCEASVAFRQLPD